MKYLLAFCFITFHALVFGQKIIVLNSVDGLPIANAIIQLNKGNNEKLEFHTGVDGSAPLPTAWKKEVIAITAVGFTTQLKTPADWSWNKLKVQLQPRNIVFTTFEVLSTRILAPAKSLPIDVIHLDKAFLNNPLNMADALEKSGEVFVQKSQLGGGSPVLRGMEANRILLVLDGVRLNTPIFRAGHLQNILRLDPNVSSNIEIIQGSASPFYGSDAIGGVISVSTIQPKFSTIDKIQITGGTQLRLSSGNLQYWDQERAAHAWFNVGFKKLAFRTSFTANSFGDLRQGSNGIEPLWKNSVYSQTFQGKDSALVNKDPLLQKRSGYEQFDLSQRGIYVTSRGNQHHLNLQFTKSSDVSRYDRLSELKNNIPLFSEWYYGPEQRALVSYQLKLNRPTSFYSEGKIIAAWQLNKESRNTRRFQNPSLNSRFEEVNSYSINADFKKMYRSNTFYYGLELYHHEVNSTANSTDITTGNQSALATRYPAGGSVVDNGSVYVTVQREFIKNKKLIGTAGIRYTYNSLESNFGNQQFYPFPFNDVRQINSVACGQFGLVYNLNGRARLRTQWSQGFRSANVDDLAKVFDSTPGLLIVPNTNLKAERSNSFDLAMLINPEGDFNIEFGAFATILDDAIVTRPSIFNGADSLAYDGVLSAVYSNVNADKAQIFGGSMRLNWKINSKTEFKLNSTFTYGDVISNSIKAPQDHIPPLFGKFQLNRKVTSKISSSIWVIYNASKTLNRYSPGGEDNLQYATLTGMPAWQTFNISMNYTISRLSSCELSIENLMDTNYRTFSSGISASGRLVRLTIKSSF